MEKIACHPWLLYRVFMLFWNTVWKWAWDRCFKSLFKCLVCLYIMLVLNLHFIIHVSVKEFGVWRTSCKGCPSHHASKGWSPYKRPKQSRPPTLSYYFTCSPAPWCTSSHETGHECEGCSMIRKLVLCVPHACTAFMYKRERKLIDCNIQSVMGVNFHTSLYSYLRWIIKPFSLHNVYFNSSSTVIYWLAWKVWMLWPSSGDRPAQVLQTDPWQSPRVSPTSPGT